jgi:hypothetical protein
MFLDRFCRDPFKCRDRKFFFFVLHIFFTNV